MIKPHLWSKSINCIGEIYWWLKCVEAGKDYHSYETLEDVIIDLTLCEDDNAQTKN